MKQPLVEGMGLYRGGGALGNSERCAPHANACGRNGHRFNHAHGYQHGCIVEICESVTTLYHLIHSTVTTRARISLFRVLQLRPGVYSNVRLDCTPLGRTPILCTSHLFPVAQRSVRPLIHNWRMPSLRPRQLWSPFRVSRMVKACQRRTSSKSNTGWTTESLNLTRAMAHIVPILHRRTLKCLMGDER